MFMAQPRELVAVHVAETKGSTTADAGSGQPRGLVLLGGPIGAFRYPGVSQSQQFGIDRLRFGAAHGGGMFSYLSGDAVLAARFNRTPGRGRPTANKRTLEQK